MNELAIATASAERPPTLGLTESKIGVMNGPAMSIFTIDSENNITFHAGHPAGTDPTTVFVNAKDLDTITSEWPTSRLVETWNSFAGVAPFDDLKPVKKFTDREVAIRRIWNAIQRLSPRQQGADVAKETASATETASAGKSRAKAPKAAKKPKEPKAAKPPRAKKERVAKEGSKTDIVLGLLKRAKGASSDELMKATGWQSHSVRGFLSGTLKKKMKLKVLSVKAEDGTRRYSIKD